MEKLCDCEKPKLRTQFSPRNEVRYVDFPESQVQSNMSPSISQMVKKRAVGGQIDEYAMDGIAEDAPFDSEYVDFFDAADMSAEAVEAAAQQRDSNNKIAAEHRRKSAAKSKAAPSDDGGDPPELTNESDES